MSIPCASRCAAVYGNYAIPLRNIVGNTEPMRLLAKNANDDTEDGKPVRTRLIWSGITPTSGHWEQAESTDGGKTWETDWIMDLKRVQ